MADIRRSMRELFLEGVKAVNTAANHLAEATRSKVDELNLRNRRHELTDKLAGEAYEQWLQGAELPEALAATLQELHGVEEKLAAMEKRSETPETPSNSATEEPETTEEPVADSVSEEPADFSEPVEAEPPRQAVPTIDLDAITSEPEEPMTDK